MRWHWCRRTHDRGVDVTFAAVVCRPYRRYRMAIASLARDLLRIFCVG